ncbi:MAG: hypothetical protein JXA42_22575 [Anaerolineales bacterium]|nr:hypothetical protein [Anaerolineales bacterium]
MTCQIIRKIRLAHCKRGPERCELCKKMDAGRICLLDICPPDPGMVQRRAIRVTMDGEECWREFDVIRQFESEREALAFAKENNIEDVEF